MALTDKLSAIGEAIRYKTETTELLSLDAMPAAIESIETGTPPMLYNRIDSNEDGSFTLTDLESKTHTLVPTYAENGDVIAVQLDDYEMIPVSHNADGYMTGIFLTTTDFTNVQIEEEEVAAIYASIVANEDGTSSFTDKDGVVHTLTPLTIDENGAITAVQFDGEDIPLTYSVDSTLIAIGETTVDFSNVIAEDEPSGSNEEAYYCACYRNSGTTDRYFYSGLPNRGLLDLNLPDSIQNYGTGYVVKFNIVTHGTMSSSSKFDVHFSECREDGTGSGSKKVFAGLTNGEVQEVSYDLSNTFVSANPKYRIYINMYGTSEVGCTISNVRVEEVVV